ncbi:MAG: hypothetical protein PWP09_1399 [Thermotogota bacterium]|nr:hypothetical protein [Thermotogota bacterium]
MRIFLSLTVVLLIVTWGFGLMGGTDVLNAQAPFYDSKYPLFATLKDRGPLIDDPGCFVTFC